MDLANAPQLPNWDLPDLQSQAAAAGRGHSVDLVASAAKIRERIEAKL